MLFLSEHSFAADDERILMESERTSLVGIRLLSWLSEAAAGGGISRDSSAFRVLCDARQYVFRLLLTDPPTLAVSRNYSVHLVSTCVSTSVMK